MSELSADPRENPVPAIRGEDVQGTDTNGLAGFSFSLLGLFGWLGTFLFIHVLEFAKTGEEDLFGVFVVYLKQVAVGLFGVGASGVFSFAGSVISLVGLGEKKSQAAVPGLVMGLIGILCGFGLVMWRVHAWMS
ncbi:MAG: hypothetical protein JNL58_02690 [Planctomyces sp.]|nr:hypothetical protein [Planctomyces sp.]